MPIRVVRYCLKLLNSIVNRFFRKEILPSISLRPLRVQSSTNAPDARASRIRWFFFSVTPLGIRQTRNMTSPQSEGISCFTMSVSYPVKISLELEVRSRKHGIAVSKKFNNAQRISKFVFFGLSYLIQFYNSGKHEVCYSPHIVEFFEYHNAVKS